MQKSIKISERCMLANLRISQWHARRYDKKATDEVLAKHTASANAGRFHKLLLPVDSDSHKAIVTIAGQMRTCYYFWTLPWCDDGQRILPAAAYMPFTATMAQLAGQFDDAVNAFCTVYPRLVQEARQALNGLYNEMDYPSAERLRQLYSSKVSFAPLPAAEDFRCNLDDASVAAIQAAIEHDVKQAVETAQKDAVTRLREALERMSERLNQPEAIFRDTLFTNLLELCAVLPALNITGDPQLKLAVDLTVANVLPVAPETCRVNKVAREQAASECDAIIERMKGLA